MKRKTKMDDYEQWRAQALKDPAIRKALEEGDDDPAVEIAWQMLTLRKRQGWTQAQLARKLHTSQQAIARLESLDYSGYTLKMLQKVAAAFDKRLKIHFI